VKVLVQFRESDDPTASGRGQVGHVELHGINLLGARRLYLPACGLPAACREESPCARYLQMTAADAQGRDRCVFHCLAAAALAFGGSTAGPATTAAAVPGFICGPPMENADWAIPMARPFPAGLSIVLNSRATMSGVPRGAPIFPPGVAAKTPARLASGTLSLPQEAMDEGLSASNCPAGLRSEPRVLS